MVDRRLRRARVHARARRGRCRTSATGPGRTDVRVLVVNAGSTSLKLPIVDERRESSRSQSLDACRSTSTAVGHRVVHGGERFRRAGRDRRRGRGGDRGARVARAAAQRAGARARSATARRALPDVPHVAVFDTAFHATIPAEASTYAVPARWREEWGIRRYGFHGLVGRSGSPEQVRVPRLVVCHLGGGCSVTAVLDGRSVDTTMGFSPLEGVPMATRSGLGRPRRAALPAPRARAHAGRARPRARARVGPARRSAARRPRELAGTPALDVYAYRVAHGRRRDGGRARRARRARLHRRRRREPADVRGRVVERLGFLGDVRRRGRAGPRGARDRARGSRAC